MKLLIIICAHEFNSSCCNYIKIIDDYAKLLDMEIDYCGISNQDDFHNYENIIKFKYKIVNTKKQFSKICDFLTDYKTELDYDWYMKIRPDLKLLEKFNFDILSTNAVNARARVYYGPKKIKNGMSVNGAGQWRHIGDCRYSNHEHSIILDDMLFIFHKNILQMGAFDKVNLSTYENEWIQSGVFNERKIPQNVIGIYFENTKHRVFSGDVNM